MKLLNKAIYYVYALITTIVSGKIIDYMYVDVNLHLEVMYRIMFSVPIYLLLVGIDYVSFKL